MGGNIDLAKLNIEIDSDDVSEATERLRKFTDQGQKTEKGFGSMARSIAGWTTGYQFGIDVAKKALAIIKDTGAEAIRLAASFEKSRMTYGVLVQDVGRGNKLFEELRTLAAETPYAFRDFDKAAQTLLGFGVEAGDLVDTLTKLGDVSRGDGEAMGRLALAYGQVKAQGKAMTQDLYQFVNAGVPIFDALAKTMGVSTGEIKDLTAAGKVGFAEVQAALKSLTGEGGQYHDMMEKVSQTAEGKWSTAVDNMNGALARLGEKLLKVAVPALDAFNESMEASARRANYRAAVAGKGGDVDSAIVDAMAERARLEKALADMKARAAVAPVQISKYMSEGVKSLEAELAQVAIAVRILQDRQMQAAVAAGSAAKDPAPTAAWDAGWEDTFKGLTGVDTGAGKSASAVNEYVTALLTAAEEERKFGATTADIFGGVRDNIRDTYKALLASGKFNETDVTLVELKGAYDALTLAINRDGEATGEWVSELESAGPEATNVFREATDEEKKLAVQTDITEQSLKALGEQLKSLAIDAAADVWIESFEALGRAMIASEDGADTLKDSLRDIASEILAQLPSLLFYAGVQLLATNPVVGLSLIASSGLAAIGGGIASEYLGTTQNAKGAVYGGGLGGYRPGVYTEPQRFQYAKGAAFGWEGMRAFARGAVFAEAGAELLAPLHVNSRGEMGIGAIAPSVSVNIVNNLGVQAEARVVEESNGMGARQLTLYLERAVSAAIAGGGADSALRSRYGLAPAGRRVL